MGQAKEKKHFEGVNKIDAHNWHANSASDSNQHKTARTGIWVTSFTYDFILFYFILFYFILFYFILSIRSYMQDMDIIDRGGESAGTLACPSRSSARLRKCLNLT